MSGFDLSTGSIDLISQPGDIPLDGGSSGPSCNHECPKCCPPDEATTSSGWADFFLILVYVMVIFGFCAAGIYISGPHS